jgi:hypothetical protein
VEVEISAQGNSADLMYEAHNHCAESKYADTGNFSFAADYCDFACGAGRN